MKNELENRISIGVRCYLDLEREVLVKNALYCALSRIEFRLLHKLAVNFGKVVTTKELIDYGWLTGSYVNPHELHVYISRLRKKLQDKTGDQMFVINVHGVGYMLNQTNNNILNE